MNSKILPIMISAVVSFVILAGLSYLLEVMMNPKHLNFLDFLKVRWYYYAAIITVFLVYTNYKGKNLK